MKDVTAGLTRGRADHERGLFKDGRRWAAIFSQDGTKRSLHTRNCGAASSAKW